MQESGTRVLAPSLALAVPRGHLRPPPQAPELSLWKDRGCKVTFIMTRIFCCFLRAGLGGGGLLLKRLFLLPFDPSLLETLNIA